MAGHSVRFSQFITLTYFILSNNLKKQFKLVLIVTGTVTDVPQTSPPHSVSGAYIVNVIGMTGML